MLLALPLRAGEGRGGEVNSEPDRPALRGLGGGGEPGDLPGGDLDRVKRQQQYLRAMFGKLFSSDTFTNPSRLDSALLAVTSAVSIDDSLGNADLLALAYSMRNVTPDNVDYFTRAWLPGIRRTQRIVHRASDHFLAGGGL